MEPVPVYETISDVSINEGGQGKEKEKTDLPSAAKLYPVTVYLPYDEVMAIAQVQTTNSFTSSEIKRKNGKTTIKLKFKKIK